MFSYYLDMYDGDALVRRRRRERWVQCMLRLNFQSLVTRVNFKGKRVNFQ